MIKSDVPRSENTGDSRIDMCECIAPAAGERRRGPLTVESGMGVHLLMSGSCSIAAICESSRRTGWSKVGGLSAGAWQGARSVTFLGRC